MQVLKVTFIAIALITTCSFAFRTAITSSEDGRGELLEDFLSEFKAYNLPAMIEFKLEEENTLYDLEKEGSTAPKILGTKYSTFIPAIDQATFSRMGAGTYEAEALLVSDKNTLNTVIYSRYTSYRRYSKSYFMTTFDEKGQQIATKHLGNVHQKQLLKLSSNESMEMTVKEMTKGSSDDSVDVTIKKVFVKPSGKIIEHWVMSN